MPPTQPLPPAFFARPTLVVARDILGKSLVYEHPAEGRLAGRVVETEAYTADDPAMHGWKASFDEGGFVRPVGRAAALFGPPGTAYVYRLYYTNWLLNVVTEPEGTAGAVLVRALEPLEGVEAMRARRPLARRAVDLTNGPGKLTQALDVADARFHGSDLTRPPLYFVDYDYGPPLPDVAVSSRIGLTRGVDRPYRFYIPRSPYVSPGEPSDLRVARRTKRRGA